MARVVRTGLLVVCLVVVISTLTSSLQPDRTPQPEIGLLRVVNTLQAELHRAQGHYGTLADMVEHFARLSDLADLATLRVVDPGTAVMGDLTLALVRAEDGQRYQAMITPAERCARALFTSETGLIYVGRGLGCAP